MRCDQPSQERPAAWPPAVSRTDDRFHHQHVAIADAGHYCDGLVACAQAIGIPPITVSLSHDARPGFRAVLDWWQDSRAVSIVAGRTNRTVDQRVLSDDLWPGMERVLVGCLLRGRMTLHTADDRVACFGPDDVFVTDYARPLRLRWNAHEVVYLVLPQAVMGSAWAAARPGGFERLPRSGLQRLLVTLLREFLISHGEMDAAATALALQTAVELAAGCVHAVRSRPAPDSGSAAKLLEAAQHYIEGNCHVPRLSAAMIAQALGCSRSNLYRAFAAADASVMESVVAARMCRARALMSDPATAADLAEVALACGYGDLSAFGKAFRRAAGVTPSGWRRLAAGTIGPAGPGHAD